MGVQITDCMPAAAAKVSRACVATARSCLVLRCMGLQSASEQVQRAYQQRKHLQDGASRGAQRYLEALDFCDPSIAPLPQQCFGRQSECSCPCTTRALLPLLLLPEAPTCDACRMRARARGTSKWARRRRCVLLLLRQGAVASCLACLQSELVTMLLGCAAQQELTFPRRSAPMTQL